MSEHEIRRYANTAVVEPIELPAIINQQAIQDLAMQVTAVLCRPVPHPGAAPDDLDSEPYVEVTVPIALKVRVHCTPDEENPSGCAGTCLDDLVTRAERMASFFWPGTRYFHNPDKPRRHTLVMGGLGSLGDTDFHLELDADWFEKVDRLTHHVHILTMNGDSYRLKQSSGRRRSQAPAKRAEQHQATDDAVNPETGEISAT